MNTKLKLSSLTLAGILTTTLATQAAVSVVGGWTVNDDSFLDDPSGTYSDTLIFNSSEDDNGHWNDTSRATFDAGSATWTFLGLANGEYEVAASWSYAGNRATDPFYNVQGGPSIVVDQQLEATGGPVLTDNLAQDISFQMLTSTAVVSDGTLTVTLSPGAGSFIVDAVADAVAIRAIPEPSSAALLGLGGVALILRRRK